MCSAFGNQGWAMLIGAVLEEEAAAVFQAEWTGRFFGAGAAAPLRGGNAT